MNTNTGLLSNLVLNTDSYKLSHFPQYPAGTTTVYSFGESRGCSFSPVILMYGIQGFIKQYLTKKITRKDIEFAKMFSEKHGEPFNYEGWLYVLEKYNGYLPVKIRAVREGTVLPTHNVMFTIENTDPKCFWLTSYLETALLRALWYPSTVATISFLAKKTIYRYLTETSDNPDAEINFKLQDFGARGVSSLESAGIGGSAHLVNFMGSDTISGILYAMEYYDADVCGFSIPASEHSTMTALGPEGEYEQFKRMVDAYAKPNCLLACVSDSYNIYKATAAWHDTGLLNRVKEAGATLVIRPDSGDPTTVAVEIIEQLMKTEGYTVNTKGYRVLPNYVRVIQGDGMTLETIGILLENLKKVNISASNIAFGMGGGLLQKCDRDTFKFAMKCSAMEINGKFRDVYKDPITDSGKRSKKGRMTLVLSNEDLSSTPMTKRIEEVSEKEIDLMHTVYENGPIEAAYETFDKIRERTRRFL